MTRWLRISWIGLLLGLAIGLALGLVYTWQIAPVIEFDTQPAQLSKEARTDYMIAISLAYRTDGDLRLAVDRLLELGLGGDPFQVVADTACEVFRQGVDDTQTLNAIESMIALYSPQGRTGCADGSGIFMVNQATATPFPTEIPTTPTLPPPATKTPTVPPPVNVTPPTLAPTQIPTEVPSEDDYIIANIQTFCSVSMAGTIEVYVQYPGVGEIPGEKVRVFWDGGEDIFFTGLKPERGLGYADFTMDANRSYTVEIPDRSPRSTTLTASPCTVEGGERSTTSYRVIFRRN